MHLLIPPKCPAHFGIMVLIPPDSQKFPNSWCSIFLENSVYNFRQPELRYNFAIIQREVGQSMILTAMVTLMTLRQSRRLFCMLKVVMMTSIGNTLTGKKDHWLIVTIIKGQFKVHYCSFSYIYAVLMNKHFQH